jgi:hypothetical protein
MRQMLLEMLVLLNPQIKLLNRLTCLDEGCAVNLCLFYSVSLALGNLFISFCYCVAMGAIPQKWIFACVNCGCIFTTMAEKQTGICPVCKSRDRNTIEGFIY